MLRVCVVFASPRTVDLLGHLMHHWSLAASQTAAAVAENSVLTKCILIQTGQLSVSPIVTSILIIVVSISLRSAHLLLHTCLMRLLQLMPCDAGEDHASVQYNSCGLTFLGL